MLTYEPDTIGHHTHPHNSSSYSGRMLTHGPDIIELGSAAVHNQLSASNSTIYAATSLPLRASSTDVIRFPTRRARMLDETSAFNSGTHASAFVPLRDHYMHPHSSSSYSRRMLNREPDSYGLIRSAASSSRIPAETLLPLQENFDDVHRQAALHNQLSVSSSRIHPAMLPPRHANTTQEFAELSLGQPGSEQLTPRMLMRNTEVDIKGKRPASEVDQIKEKILRLNVASGTISVGPKSAVGVLIRDDSTAQFMTASCFRPMPCMDPALLFAAACCEGIKIAVLMYEPTTIVLESHQVPLLQNLDATQSGAAEAVQLNQYLHSRSPNFIIRTIPVESNGAAWELVCHALQMEQPKKVCKDLPYWLVPYLDQ